MYLYVLITFKRWYTTQILKYIPNCGGGKCVNFLSNVEPNIFLSELRTIITSVSNIFVNSTQKEVNVLLILSSNTLPAIIIEQSLNLVLHMCFVRQRMYIQCVTYFMVRGHGLHCYRFRRLCKTNMDGAVLCFLLTFQ